MKIKIITVGKIKTKHWQAAEQDYIKRIKRYCEIQQIFAKEASQEALKNDDLVKESEVNEIRKKIHV